MGVGWTANPIRCHGKMGLYVTLRRLYSVPPKIHVHPESQNKTLAGNRAWRSS